MSIQKITYIRPPLHCCNKYLTNSGKITIVSNLVKTIETSFLEFGVSFASPKDMFNKKQGVNNALIRLSKKEKSRFYGKIEISNNDITNDTLLMAIISHILLKMKYPKHAKNLLRNKFSVTGLYN